MINSSHARMPMLFKSLQEGQAEALRTWSGRNVYQAALSRKALCSSRLRALGN